METLKALERFDGAVLRFYTADKQIVATCVFGIPAFRQGADADTFLSEPLAPDMKAPGGLMAFAMIGLRNSHTPVGPITVGGLDSDAVFKFENLTIERGSMVCIGEIQMRNDQSPLRQIRAALEKIIKPKLTGSVSTTHKKKRLTEAGRNADLERGSLGERILRSFAKGAHGLDALDLTTHLNEPEDDVVLAMNELFHLDYIENAE